MTTRIARLFFRFYLWGVEPLQINTEKSGLAMQDRGCHVFKLTKDTGL